MHFSALSLGLMFLLAAAHAHPSSPVGANRFAKRQGKDLGNSACVGACVKAPETLDCGKNIQVHPFISVRSILLYLTPLRFVQNVS